MDLKEDGLHIWRYTVDAQEYHLEKTSPLLSREEQERCNAYMNEAEKIRYTCNHRFVRHVLAKYLGILPAQVAFSHAKRGKPFIKDSGIFFNYSYRSTFGLLAIAKQEVGVDIEKIKPLHDLVTFADFSFSTREKEIIFKSDEKIFQDTLFTFWTFKEAIIKCLGVGLNADLTQIDLSDFFYKDVNPLAFDGGTTYTIKRMQALDGYKAAFAVKGEISSCAEFNFSAH
jgi:4'-phosphopantetheinyl transferase